MATDEEVQEARERVERLRLELENNERERVDRERELSNEITLKQLAAEEERLKAQLAQQGDSSSEESVRRGAQSPIAAVQSDLDRAVALQKAVADNVTTSQAPADTSEKQPSAPASPIAATPPPAPEAPASTTRKGAK